VELHRFEQHEPWFVARNPDGQVPVLDHVSMHGWHRMVGVIARSIQKARPGMAAALKAEDRTDPRLRTFTGYAK
jgi:hypothetical protein